MNSTYIFSKKISALLLASFVLLSGAAIAAQIETPYTTHTSYNFAGQVTGVLKPHPDTSNRFLATRNTYQNGLLTMVQSGKYEGSLPPEGTDPNNWSSSAFTAISTKIISYDSLDRKIAEVTQGVGGDVTEYSYDDYSRISCVAKRLNGILTGNACTSNTSGANPDRITKYIYNVNGKPTVEIRALGTPDEQNYVINGYDSEDVLIEQTDANGNATRLDYDEHHRLKTMHFPDKNTKGLWSATDKESYTYDANGNRETLIKRDGRTITYTYDALNRVTFKDIPGSTSDDVKTTYDLLNLKETDLFASGQGILTTFDGFGQLVKETNNLRGTDYIVQNQYDKHGNRELVRYPDNKEFTYHYNTLDQSLDIMDGGQVLVYNQVDEYARASTQSTMGMGAQAKTQTSLAYDAAVGRIKTISRIVADQAYNINYEFQYNTVGQIINQRYSNDNYDYKEQGSKVGAYTVNGLNQYTSVGGAGYGYDLNGNLTCDAGFNPSSRACTGNSYYYDVENRLTRVESGSQVVALKYDPLGRLYSVSSGGGTTFFVFSGDSMIAEYQNWNMIKRHVFGVGVDKPVVTYTVNQVVADPRQFLHSNHQGSVVAATDSTGSILYVNAYDAYGVPGAANQGRFAYTGQAYLPELGMYYYKARIYAPKIGRFLQTDPIGYKDDYDLYTYVGNDPMNKTDPTGLFEFDNCKNSGGGKYTCGASSDDGSSKNKKSDPVVKGVKSDMRQHQSSFKKKENFGVIYMKGTTMKSYVVTGQKTNVSAKDVQRAYAAAKSDGATKYIGEWHNHPTEGGSWSMSKDDVDSANSVQNQLSGEYRPFFSTPDLNVIEWDASATSVRQASSTDINHGKVNEDNEQ